jgi:hypothetical protein
MPGTPVAGKNFKASVFFFNGGSLPSPPIKVKVWANLTGPDLPCNTTTPGDKTLSAGRILPGASKAVKFTLKAPSAPGAAVTLAALVDTTCTGAVAASYGGYRELGYKVADNATKRPDLRVKGYYAPLIVVAGGKYDLNVTLANFGTAPVPAGTKVSLFPFDPTTATYPLPTKPCGAPGAAATAALAKPLKPGKSVAVAFTGFTAPAADPATPYPQVTMLAVADPDCMLPGDRANSQNVVYVNYFAQPEPYYSIALAQPKPKKPEAGAQMTLTLAVTNIGPADGAPGELRVYMLNDTFSSPCDPAVTPAVTKALPDALKAGASLEAVLQAPAPAVGGRWYYAAAAICGSPPTNRVFASRFSVFEVRAA